jgi:hypothetical protein
VIFLPIGSTTLVSDNRAASRYPAVLKRPRSLLAFIAGLLVSVPLSLNASCHVHEIGHALTATALGWKVDRINLCLPAGGSVRYASTPGGNWVDVAESYAGGIVGAAFLVSLYLAAFFVPKTPLRGPAWFGAGFGPLLWIGPQIVVAIVEGNVRSRDYGELLEENPALSVSLVLLTMLTGGAVHLWLWRSLWRPGGYEPGS